MTLLWSFSLIYCQTYTNWVNVWGHVFNHSGKQLCWYLVVIHQYVCDFTCAQEHDSIVAIISRDTVYCNLCKPVLRVDPCEDGPTGNRVHRLVHERVHADEADDIIWEIFSGLDAWIICATWTLYGGNNKSK